MISNSKLFNKSDYDLYIFVVTKKKNIKIVIVPIFIGTFSNVNFKRLPLLH